MRGCRGRVSQEERQRDLFGRERKLEIIPLNLRRSHQSSPKSKSRFQADSKSSHSQNLFPSNGSKSQMCLQALDTPLFRQNVENSLFSNPLAW